MSVCFCFTILFLCFSSVSQTELNSPMVHADPMRLPSPTVFFLNFFFGTVITLFLLAHTHTHLPNPLSRWYAGFLVLALNCFQQCVSFFLASQVHGCRQRHLILWGPAPRWASRGFNLQQQMKCIPIRCLGSKMSSFWEEQNKHLDICWSKFYRMLKHVQCKLLTRRIGDQVYSHEVAAYILRAILWTARQLVDVQQSKPFRCSLKPSALKVMPFLSIFTSRAAMPRTQTPCIRVSADFTMLSWQLSKDSSSTALFPIKAQHGFLSRPASFSANESRKSSAALRFASLVTIVSACEDMRKWNADESEFILLPNLRFEVVNVTKIANDPEPWPKWSTSEYRCTGSVYLQNLADKTLQIMM